MVWKTGLSPARGYLVQIQRAYLGRDGHGRVRAKLAYGEFVRLLRNLRPPATVTRHNDGRGQAHAPTEPNSVR
jgi:hypothetical protein